MSRYDYQFLCHDAKGDSGGEGGGGPGLNIIMTLIKKNSLEVFPKRYILTLMHMTILFSDPAF